MISRDEQNSAPLARRLPQLQPNPPEDQGGYILNAFLDYVAELGLELYPAQEEAILELLDDNHVILNTPTGSGKSLVAAALHFRAMAENSQSVYTCPIKALVNEKFFDLCDMFGPENVGLLTGDASVNHNAPIICCTAEVLANMGLRSGTISTGYVVMDEFHYYGDPERGAAWHIPLITAPGTQFLMMSATLGDCSHIADKLNAYSNRKVSHISSGERPVPLSFSYLESPIHEAVDELVRGDKAPVYLVNFTQRSAAEQAQNLTSISVCSKEDRQEITRQLQGVRMDSPYGKDLSRLLRNGIGVHHAGLLPRYRLLVERLAQAGLLKVVSGTDSLGVGVNIPIRTVLFTQLSKFDGQKTGLLTARDFHQIAGRAGRKGFDDHGQVVALAPEHVVENRRLEAKIAAAPHLRKKLVKKKPPRGFVNWDQGIFERLVASPPEPLEARLGMNHGILMNVLREESGTPDRGYRRLVEMVGRSHLREAEKKIELRKAASLFRALRGARIVAVSGQGDGDGGERRGSRVLVDDYLQDDFSLNQTLSLYMVETIHRLPPDSEDYHLEVLSLVEAVQESPKVILLRQVDKLKGDLVSQLKAEGVPYEERMEQLDKVEHPKPMADFIYDTFNEFSRSHPWVGGENIRPKSIARDLYERGMNFNEYVREYGLARSEGVLLRYLSQTWKAAAQSVPRFYWSEDYEDMLAFLLTTIRLADSSLLEAWEEMVEGGEQERRGLPVRRSRSSVSGADGEDDGGGAPRKVRIDPKKDIKGFQRRIRSELHLLLGALAAGNYEEAVSSLLFQDDGDRDGVERGGEGWTEEMVGEAMGRYYAEHQRVLMSPESRKSEHTSFLEISPGLWEVQQNILDEEGVNDWAIVCRVDLRSPRDLDLPFIELCNISG